MRKIAFK